MEGDLVEFEPAAEVVDNDAAEAGDALAR